MRILIYGYYGMKNLGDDYILYSILDMLGKYQLKNDNIDEVVILSKKDNYVELLGKYKNLNCKIETYGFLSKLRYLITELKNFDLYIYGGGGLFTEDSFTYFLPLWVEFVLCTIYRCKVILFGVDVVRISKAMSRRIWKKVLSICERAVVRNRYSYEILRSIAKEKDVDKLLFCPDLTFSFDTETEKNRNLIGEVLYKLGLNDRKYIVWALANPFNDEELKDNEKRKRLMLLVEQMDCLIDAYINAGYYNVFLPFFSGSDEKILERLGLDKKNGCLRLSSDSLCLEEKRAVFSSAEIAIAMRFHGIAFSLFYGLPTAAICYAPKAETLMQEAGLTDYIVKYGIRSNMFYFDEFDLDYEYLKDVISKAISQVDKSRFATASQELKKNAKKSVETLYKVLDELRG